MIILPTEDIFKFESKIQLLSILIVWIILPTVYRNFTKVTYSLISLRMSNDPLFFKHPNVQRIHCSILIFPYLTLYHSKIRFCMYTLFIHTLSTIVWVERFILCPELIWLKQRRWYISEATTVFLNLFIFFLKCMGIKGWLCSFFIRPNCNRKYNSFYLWPTLNIRPQNLLVKFWFSGLKIIFNPIKFKFKPTFIVKLCSFKIIHIIWFIILLSVSSIVLHLIYFNWSETLRSRLIYLINFLIYFGMNSGSL